MRMEAWVEVGSTEIVENHERLYSTCGGRLMEVPPPWWRGRQRESGASVTIRKEKSSPTDTDLWMPDILQPG